MALPIFKNVNQRQYQHTTYSKEHVPMEALKKQHNCRLFLKKMILLK